ncbi:nitrogenase component 1 [Alkaliphilus transvaalensis]|uniref:nitrogenase component 1 n=1 Tax=Alkaliphilus transvaalensis TaxID=114628 RepID=UPI0006883C92|nr:nitrogenase component 1 [Alkaliphilus transvaalensis]
MQLHKYLPLPSDRMGTLWALTSIKDACIIEYGPAGTTHYGIEGFMQLNAELRAKLYTTHMDETNIVMGDCERLEETIKEVDAVYNPPVIFVLASTISSIIGADIENICENIQNEVKAKLVPFSGGGLRGDYTLGIKEVLTSLAMDVVKEPTEKLPKTYNIIGCNIDQYNFASDLKELEGLMEAYFGYKLHAVFSGNSSIQEIQEASKAEFNIVLRGEGIKCAEVLKEKFQMDYYFGAPYGFKGTINWLKGIEKSFSLKGNDLFLGRQMEKSRRLIMRMKQSTFTIKQFRGILSGNFDFVMDIYPFLMDELSINLTKLIVNHSGKDISHRNVVETMKEKLIFNPSEEAKEDLLLKEEPQIIFGDGILLEMGKEVSMMIQVSNPNLHQIQIFEGTPFMGFNGAIYLIEVLLNQISHNRKNLKSKF